MSQIYKIEHVSAKTMYIFKEPTSDAELKAFKNFNKSNEKIDSVSEYLEGEITFMKKNIKRGINIQVIPFFINDFDNIHTIKKKLMMLREDLYFTEIHLWCQLNEVSNNVSKKILNNYSEVNNDLVSSRFEKKYNHLVVEKFVSSVGISYENDDGIVLVNPNPYLIDGPLPECNIIPVNHLLIGDFIIHENLIYMEDFESFKSSSPDNTERNLLALRYFYPEVSNNPDEEMDEFKKANKIELERVIDTYNKLNSKIVKENTLVVQETTVYDNLVLQVNRPFNVYKESKFSKPIDLYNIFKKLDLDEDIPYIRYRDIDRKYHTKLASDKLFIQYYDDPTEGLQQVGEYEKYNLSKCPQYFQEYNPNLRQTKVSKRDILSWSASMISFRERQQMFYERQESDSERRSSPYELVLKVKMDRETDAPQVLHNYVTLVIREDGHFYVKCLNSKGYLNYETLFCQYLNKIHSVVIPRINKLTKNKVPYFYLNRNICLQYSKSNVEVTSFNAKVNIITSNEVTFARLAEEVKYLVGSFIFDNKFIQSKKKKSSASTVNSGIKMTFVKVNGGNSSLSIRNHYINLREIISNADKFLMAWISDCESLFQMSELESRKAFETIREEIERSPNMKVGIYEDNKVNVELLKLGSSEFELSVTDCPSFKTFENIKYCIEQFLERCSREVPKPTPSEEQSKPPEPEVVIPEVVVQSKKKTFVNDDADEFDDDDVDEFDEFDDEDLYEDDNEDVPESTKPPEVKVSKPDASEVVGGGGTVADKTGSSAEDTPKILTLDKKTLRMYTPALRKLLDEKLFDYAKTNEFEQYSRLCGAVDNRQPFIMTPAQWRNFQSVNPEGFEEYQSGKEIYLPWGSTKEKVNYYICPRIYCFRDNFPLTINQFLANDGKCPFCNGNIITNSTITKTNTVLIRIGGKKKYWGDAKLNAEFIKKYGEKYNTFLKDSEKWGIPGLIDPKSHPSQLCMPCCYSTTESPEKTKPIIKNIDKCLKHTVTYWKNFKTKQECIDYSKDINLGNEIDTSEDERTRESYILREGDEVLLTYNVLDKENTYKYYNIFKVTKKGTKRVSKVSQLDINLENASGLEIETRNPYSQLTYTVEIDSATDTKYGVLKMPNIKESEYIINWNRRPIPHLRGGKLPDLLNSLFSNNLEKDIKKGRLQVSTEVFLRRGIKNNPNNSFIMACNAEYFVDNAENEYYQLVELLIDQLSFSKFISLNNGDLVNQFAPDFTNDKLRHEICYGNLDKFKEFVKVTPEFDNLKPNISTVTSEVLFNSLDMELVGGFRAFNAFEFFKKYLGDENIYKDYQLLWDLMSQSFNDENGGLIEEKNILILDYTQSFNDEGNLSIVLPRYAKVYKEDRKLIILLKYNDMFSGKEYFEPIGFYKNKKTINLSFTKTTLPKSKAPILNKLYSQLKSRTDKYSLKEEDTTDKRDTILFLGKLEKDARADYMDKVILDETIEKHFNYEFSKFFSSCRESEELVEHFISVVKDPISKIDDKRARLMPIISSILEKLYVYSPSTSIKCHKNVEYKNCQIEATNLKSLEVAEPLGECTELNLTRVREYIEKYSKLITENILNNKILREEYFEGTFENPYTITGEFIKTFNDQSQLDDFIDDMYSRNNNMYLFLRTPYYFVKELNKSIDKQAIKIKINRETTDVTELAEEGKKETELIPFNGFEGPIENMSVDVGKFKEDAYNETYKLFDILKFIKKSQNKLKSKAIVKLKNGEFKIRGNLTKEDKLVMKETPGETLWIRPEYIETEVKKPKSRKVRMKAKTATATKKVNRSNAVPVSQSTNAYTKMEGYVIPGVIYNKTPDNPKSTKRKYKKGTLEEKVVECDNEPLCRGLSKKISEAENLYELRSGDFTKKQLKKQKEGETPETHPYYFEEDKISYVKN